MENPGRVHNGVEVLEGELPLPEGAAVTVGTRRCQERDRSIRDVESDCRSCHPISREVRLLTAERVAELLEAEEVSESSR